MEVKQLNEAQYMCTMGTKMYDVTESAEAVVNIWNYAKQLLKDNLISKYGFSKNMWRQFMKIMNTHINIFCSLPTRKILML